MRNDMGDGWLWVTSKSTGLSGIINRELVKDLVSFIILSVYLFDLQYFFNDVTIVVFYT